MPNELNAENHDIPHQKKNYDTLYFIISELEFPT